MSFLLHEKPFYWFIFIRHEHGELLSDRDINSVIDDIGILFDDNAKNVFGTKSSLSHDDSNVISLHHFLA
jgi:hypothetical protein